MEHCEGYMSPSLVQEGYMRVGPIKTGPGPMPPAPKMPRPQAAEQTPLSLERSSVSVQPLLRPVFQEPGPSLDNSEVPVHLPVWSKDQLVPPAMAWLDGMFEGTG